MKRIKCPTITEMIDHLIRRVGLESTVRESQCNEARLLRIRNQEEEPSKHTLARLKNVYRQTVRDDAAYSQEVKNYDHEELEDFKGGLRKGGAGGNRNNAGAIQISTIYY